jgi:hypothetical protein
MRKTLAPFLTLLCLSSALAAADQPKLTEQELVARHLDSIGSGGARDASRARGVACSVRFVMARGGVGESQGQAKLLTDGRKLRLVIELSDARYNGEDLVSDGSKAAVAANTSGLRSRLGAFLYGRRELITQGLLGGTLSAAWPLLGTASLQPKLRYEGLKKVDGRELHELRYEPRKGASDAKIRAGNLPARPHHLLGRAFRDRSALDKPQHHRQQWGESAGGQDHHEGVLRRLPRLRRPHPAGAVDAGVEQRHTGFLDHALGVCRQDSGAPPHGSRGVSRAVGPATGRSRACDPG